MQNMIENLINGNLKDARRQAKGHAMTKIAAELVHRNGWTHHRAVLAARYLKTGEGFQAYCDAT